MSNPRLQSLDLREYGYNCFDAQGFGTIPDCLGVWISGSQLNTVWFIRLKELDAEGLSGQRINGKGNFRDESRLLSPRFGVLVQVPMPRPEQIPLQP